MTCFFCQFSTSNGLKYSPILCHLHRHQDGRGGASKEVRIQGQAGKKEVFPQHKRGADQKVSTTQQPDELQQSQVAEVANSLVDMVASKARERIQLRAKAHFG
jgi:hypothetical protein